MKLYSTSFPKYPFKSYRATTLRKEVMLVYHMECNRILHKRTKDNREKLHSK